jgi:hypothetical protein
MTNQEQILKNDIMMRVRFIYGIKSLSRVFVPKLALLASLVAIAGFFVSFPNVFRNMPSILEITRFADFVISAFVHTKLFVQAVSLGTLVLMAYMVRDIVQVFQSSILRTVQIAK